MMASTTVFAFHTEEQLEPTASQLQSLGADESLRRKLRSTLESRDMPALQEVLDAAMQRGLCGAEVDRAKRLLDLLDAAYPIISNGGGMVPTQPQVHAARGELQWSGPTIAMMQHTLSCLSGEIQSRPQSSMVRMPQHSTASTLSLSEMSTAKHGDGERCWCAKEKRIQLDHGGRPLFYICGACRKSQIFKTPWGGRAQPVAMRFQVSPPHQRAPCCTVLGSEHTGTNVPMS